MYFATSISVSLHMPTSSIMKFNGLNFSEWSEQVKFHLGVLDLDLALMNDMLAILTASNSTEERSFHKAWERSNRPSLMFMWMTVANNIKSTIPETDNAKEFMKLVESRSQSDSTDKSFAWTLMGTSTTLKFNGSRTMHEHVIEMANIAARLSSMTMKVDENFLVQFVI